MDCNTCKEQSPPNVPYIVHESAMARAERTAKRLWITVLILIIMLVGSNAGWLYYESQFETVGTAEEYNIEQDSESGNTNSIINGGEISNGEPDDTL